MGREWSGGDGGEGECRQMKGRGGDGGEGEWLSDEGQGWEGGRWSGGPMNGRETR